MPFLTLHFFNIIITIVASIAIILHDNDDVVHDDNDQDVHESDILAPIWKHDDDFEAKKEKKNKKGQLWKGARSIVHLVSARRREVF